MEGGIFVNIHESAEDYLEAILKLREDHGMVRSIDIVHELGFSKPSVSIAMRNLRENGYIHMDDDGYITLLPPGEEIAQRIYDRHKLLTQVFIQLGVSRRQRRLPPPTVPGEHDGSPGCPSREAAGSRLLPLAAGDRRYRPRRTARRQRPDTNGNTDPAGNRNPVPPPEWHSGRPQRQSGRFR